MGDVIKKLLMPCAPEKPNWIVRPEGVGTSRAIDAVSCGEGSLADYMRVLADRLATSINAGQFDPTNPKEAA